MNEVITKEMIIHCLEQSYDEFEMYITLVEKAEDEVRYETGHERQARRFRQKARGKRNEAIKLVKVARKMAKEMGLNNYFEWMWIIELLEEMDGHDWNVYLIDDGLLMLSFYEHLKYFIKKEEV